MTGPVDLEISKIFEKIWEIVYTNSSDVGYLEFFAIIKTLSIFSMKVAVDDQKTDSNEINEAVRQAPLFSTAIFLHYIHSGKNVITYLTYFLGVPPKIDMARSWQLTSV